MVVGKEMGTPPTASVFTWRNADAGWSFLSIQFWSLIREATFKFYVVV